ncbi:unnamed protein product [Calypogeia fissa]
MKRSMRKEGSVLKTSRGITLFDIWGNAKGELVYEGCHLQLTDGRVCALGTVARRRREMGADFPVEEYSRARGNHCCRPIGEGKLMFRFFVQVEGEVMDVWEKAGNQLMGMTRQEFTKRFPQEEQRREFLSRIMVAQWTVTYNQLAREGQAPLNRVVEFRRLVQVKSQLKINEEQAARIDKLEEALRQLQTNQRGISPANSNTSQGKSGVTDSNSGL